MLEAFKVVLFVSFPIGAAALAKDERIMRAAIMDRQYVVYPPERDNADQPFLLPQHKVNGGAPTQQAPPAHSAP